MAATNLGQTLAKVLGIKLQYRNPTGDDLTRGESVYSVSSADPYVEQEPTTLEWIKEVIPTGRDFLHWAYHLFPFIHWIGRYNVQWLAGDLIAGMFLHLQTTEPRLKSIIRYHGWRGGGSSVDGLR